MGTEGFIAEKVNLKNKKVELPEEDEVPEAVEQKPVTVQTISPEVSALKLDAIKLEDRKDWKSIGL